MNRRNKYTFAALSLPYSLICSSLFNLYFAQLIIAKKFKIDFTKCNCKFYFIVCHEFCLQKVKRRCDKTSKTSVVEAEKRTNRASIDSEVFELPLNSFVLEPDYADITKRPRLISQPLPLQFIKLVRPNRSDQLNKVFTVFRRHQCKWPQWQC